jgi:hypothetical protein
VSSHYNGSESGCAYNRPHPELVDDGFEDNRAVVSGQLMWRVSNIQAHLERLHTVKFCQRAVCQWYVRPLKSWMVRLLHVDIERVSHSTLEQRTGGLTRYTMALLQSSA